MGIEYTNRRDEKYYLLQGKTKTGKPKYYVSRKPDGVAVEQIPEGYELYEEPERGLVSVRKLRPTKVLSEERERLAAWIRELAGIEYFTVDVQADSLAIYTPGNDSGSAIRTLSKLFGSFVDGGAEAMSWMDKTARYMPMMRFTLIDEVKRLFSVERWCYRGGIDDWHFLARARPLDVQAKKYLPHLNEESFYDLF